MVRPSTYPRSCMPSMNAASGVLWPMEFERYPMRGSVPASCASAVEPATRSARANIAANLVTMALTIPLLRNLSNGLAEGESSPLVFTMAGSSRQPDVYGERPAALSRSAQPCCWAERQLRYSTSMRLTIDLSPAQAERLRQEAERLGLAPEELARAAITDLLATPDPEFARAADRVLRKNEELYRRLA